MNHTNKIAKVLTYIGLTQMVAGFFFGLVAATDNYNEFYWLIAGRWWTISFISGMLFIGFGELIELLQKIYDSKIEEGN